MILMDIEFAINLIKLIKSYYKTFTVVGSVKREESLVKDIDILVNRKNIDEFVNKTKDIITISKRMKHMYKGFIVTNIGNIKIDIFLCTDDTFIFMKFMLESPKKYNIRIRNVAKTKGYKLSQYGLYKKLSNGKYTQVHVDSENELIKILGITKRSPKNRD